MSNWYNKEGEVIFDTEAEILLRDKNYRRIAETTLPDGKWVSTVWLGLDHRFPFFDGKNQLPLIFETMVFPKKGDYSDIDVARYETEEQAKRGHNRMVKKYS